MTTSEEPNPFRSPADIDSDDRTDVFTVFWGVLCIVGVVAIFLLPFWPGISILLAMGLAPAFVHAYIRLYRRARQGDYSEPFLQAGILLGSFFMVTGIALGTSIAGGVLCFTTVAVVSAARVGEGPLILTAFFMGVLVPLAIFGVLFAMSLGFRWKGNRSESPSLPYHSDNHESQ